MRSWLAIFVLAFVGAASPAQEVPASRGEYHHVLVRGSELYSLCQAWERNIRVTTENELEAYEATGTRRDAFWAGQCWGYIEGIVDSIPAGEGFGPDPKVRVSQFVETVMLYLRNHPEEHHLPAYTIARTALIKAFPARLGSR